MSRWSLDIECGRLPRTSRAVDVDRLLVGRGAECDVYVPDPRVSRQHFRLERRGDELWIADLGSRAGTRLNGQPLTGASLLAERDVIEISETTRVVVRRLGEDTLSGESAASGTLLCDAEALLVQRADLVAATSAADLRRYAERLHLVNEVHQALFESPSRDALLDMILDRVFASLRPEQAAVLLIDRDGNLVSSVSRPADLGLERVFFSRSLLREVTARRQAALVLDASADERFAGAQSILDSGVRSVLAAPLLTPEGPLGMIVLSSRLVVRQFGEEDLELLVPLASAAALHLRNIDLAAEAAERRLLAAELELARRIQLALLPARLPEVAGYELLAGNVPSRGVSGDLYTVDLHPERGLVTVLVCDIAGKGMAASLLGASLEALAAGPIEVAHPPDEICLRVSRRLFARTPPEKYATGFAAQLDPATHTLAWANAGHNSALLVRAGGEVERLAACGPPLGALPTAAYSTRETTLQPGDLLLIYTDGITEAVAPDDEEFGIQRLADVAQRQRALPLPELRREIERALDDFARGVPYADDRTMLFIRRREGGERVADLQ
ncbi:MAG TPA: SpoIIE family protein phosphatase [Thermoanaerobaculia bacterium]|nr:SpoIIE family protein phosphatase [Thermoanaerobaculia bacterium]